PSESGLGDWSFSNTGSRSNPGSGGNGGGFCQIGDGTGISYAYAPSRFLGNWFPLIGLASMTIDLRRLSSSGDPLVVSEFIRLSGPGGTAVVAMPAGDLPPVGRVWRSYSFPLEAASWTVTAGTWDALLANVTECRLQLEFAGSTETVGFDNFGRLAPGCAPLDLPVVVHASDVELCDHFGFAGISTVALNPADGLLYGLVDLASSSGGGLWALAGDIAGTRLAAFAQPTGLLFDAAGNAFVSEDYGGEIFRFALDSGTSLWVSGFHSGDDDPCGLCFAPAGFDGPNVDPGDILVTDCGSGGADEVWAFSAAVAENERQVMPHTGDRDFRDITAGDTGEVYLAGTIDPTTVSLLAPDGARTTLSLATPIAGMIGIAYDGVMDALYVIATGDSSLRRIDPTTGAVTLVADGFAGFNNCGIDIDSAGRRLWVADYGAGRVYEFCLASGSAAGDFGPAAGASLLAGLSAWPNPARTAVGVRFALRAETEARLEVYDLAGRLVRRLLADRLPAGERSLNWDGRDAAGRRVASGLYLLRLSAGEEVRSARVVILR
ncbi:T9SS type A sorting domain-containing protein, partial [bacterium]|nr:T9SS type A sorting domain-containing protein [bacterium]